MESSLSHEAAQAGSDILIVGGGPVGLMTAILLARQGVRSTVIDRRGRSAYAPKAHMINPRTIEICSAAGLDVSEMYRQATSTSTDHDRLTRFTTRVMDRELGSLPFECSDPDRDSSPFWRINLAQPRFEGFLIEAIEDQPLITLVEGAEWFNCKDLPNGAITSSIRCDGEMIEFRSRYLIGADGANSRVRDAVGIVMEGDENVQRCLTISFGADWRYLLQNRPSMFYWALNAKLPGVFLVYDMAKTWTYLVFDAPQAAPTEAQAREIVLDALGVDAPLTISQVLPWGLTAQVARQYRAGKTFLVGDAAHRFPPTGGLGLNTGIQDAHNLAWKIGAVLAGRATAELLDSYERERRPVAELNTRQSMKNAGNIVALLELTGDEEQVVINAAIAQTYEAFNSLGLQLGFSYGDQVAPPTIDTFTPTARIGDRLAHAWLRGRASRSVLDLLDDRRWSLLTRSPGRWSRLTLASRQTPTVIDLDLECVPEAWCELVGITAENALLVRPDGHIAARAEHPHELDAEIGSRGVAPRSHWFRECHDNAHRETPTSWAARLSLDLDQPTEVKPSPSQTRRIAGPDGLSSSRRVLLAA
jgi:2-polyprenyl-6-methoxyphenol hydroxylase-like FAD-dependent oxidoreductase